MSSTGNGALGDRLDDYLRIHGDYLTAAEAARRLNVTPRTIQRYRAELRNRRSKIPEAVNRG